MPATLGNKFAHKHGHARTDKKTPIYKSWISMRGRCLNPNNTRYERYGKRGIQICTRWSSFEAFLADMGERPTGMTLEREDNNGNYCPENCRWASQKEQQRNKRSNRMVTYAGSTHCVAEWAEALGIAPKVLINRLNRGWSVHDTLTNPKRKKGQRLYVKT